MASQYCTVAEVQSEFSDTTFGSSTSVTSTEVTALIEEFSEYVNQRISNRYTTPITDAEALLVIKIIVKYLVVAKVLRILNSDQESGAEANERTKANIYDKKAEEMLKMVFDGSLVLSDTAKTSFGMPSSYNEDEEIDPIFERDTVQW